MIQSSRKQSIFIRNNPAAPQLCPELAREIGLVESVLLLQLEFWIRIACIERDGYRWHCKSERDIQQYFLFWSPSTIHRAITHLKKREIIITANYNKHAYDRTRWFALNIDGINKLKSIKMVQDEQDV